MEFFVNKRIVNFILGGGDAGTGGGYPVRRYN